MVSVENDYYEKWLQVSIDNGVEGLFQEYLSCASRLPGASTEFNKTRSVAVHLGKPPVLSLHPKKSRVGKGLWIGYSRTNLGHHIPAPSLHESFENQETIHENNEWRFGYFNSKEELERLFTAVDLKFARVPAPVEAEQPRKRVATVSAPTEPVLDDAAKGILPTVLDSLSIDDIFEMATGQGLKPKRWGSSRLKTYNGFTHETRVRKWQAMDLARKKGLIAYADSFPCSICGSMENVAYHSEDYSRMAGHYPVCKSCHGKLHFRFSNPTKWRDFIASHKSSDGNGWYENLNMQEDAKPGLK